MGTATTTPRILFVCLGNICRSPTAEAVLRVMAPDLVVDSAGTGGWHVGDPPHAAAIRAGARRGYDLSPLRGRRLVTTDFDAFDIIVTMDASNTRDTEALRPAGNDTPVMRLLDFAPETRQRDVPDPYYTGDFDGTLDLIEAGCRGLLRWSARD